MWERKLKEYLHHKGINPKYVKIPTERKFSSRRLRELLRKVKEFRLEGYLIERETLKQSRRSHPILREYSLEELQVIKHHLCEEKRMKNSKN